MQSVIGLSIFVQKFVFMSSRNVCDILEQKGFLSDLDLEFALQKKQILLIYNNNTKATIIVYGKSAFCNKQI